MIRVVLFTCILLAGIPMVADAHWPVVREEVAQHAIEEVPDPARSRAYYARLEGHPHLYEFTLSATTTIFIQTLLPELASDSSLTKPNGLLVQTQSSGRVQEIARLAAEEAAWESEYEPFGGDHYRQGPALTKELGPGTYLFEVSTPDNMTKYVLAIGDEERWGGTNPFVLLGRIYQVKVFFEKPWYAVWQSPFYYVPTLIVLGIAVWWYLRRRR